MWKEIEKVKVMWSDWKEYYRTPCEVFTRCMGYIRPISQRNIGKRSEGYSRKYFLESKIDNSPFIKKYLVSKDCCHVD